MTDPFTVQYAEATVWRMLWLPELIVPEQSSVNRSVWFMSVARRRPQRINAYT